MQLIQLFRSLEEFGVTREHIRLIASLLLVVILIVAYRGNTSVAKCNAKHNETRHDKKGNHHGTN